MMIYDDSRSTSAKVEKTEVWAVLLGRPSDTGYIRTSRCRHRYKNVADDVLGIVGHSGQPTVKQSPAGP